MAVRSARERAFCRTREPAGVLEMLAWSPAVQGRWLLSRSCRNRREREGPPPAGAVPPAPQDPDVAGKVQLAILESLNIFSRNILLVSGCGCRLRADTGDQAAQAVS